MKQPILYSAILCILAACSGRDGTGTVPHTPFASLDGSIGNLAPHAVADGRYPVAPLINIFGTLYGTTTRGGPYNAGVVFSLTTGGLERFPYRFQGGSDGSQPSAGLLNVTGTRYGTTTYGGVATDPCSSGYPAGCGTVFSITKNRGYRQLYAFKGTPDGSRPVSDLIDVNGTLYGTTRYGGSSNRGTVFSITTDGQESVLYSFAGGTDGENPVAGLLNVNGTLYGTTEGIFGGPNCNGDCGTVFSITTSGQERVLYRFQGGLDGAVPLAGLINVNGTFYGTTTEGGGASYCSGGGFVAGCGTVFSVTRSGQGKVLYSFQGGTDGLHPQAPLLNVKGTLYGTTLAGGGLSSGTGTIFSITTTGQEQVLYRLQGSPDGSTPFAALINVNGTLYGTTKAGGTGSCSGGGSANRGCGTVFSVTTAGQEHVLHSF